MRGKTLIGLGLAAVLGLALAGPAAAQVRGVTNTSIKIGQWSPQTGPAAAWGSVARGSGVYFQMLNEQGGINGRKIEYFLRDDGYQPNRTKAVVKELLDEVGVFGFVGGVGTAPGMAVMDDLVNAKAVWVGPPTGSPHWTQPLKRTVFGMYPLYPDEAQILTRYTLDTLGKKKLAFVYQNDDYGKAGLEGAQREMKARGLTLAAEVPVEVTDTDLQSHILKMKEAGAEAAILWVAPKAAVLTVSNAAKLGYKPQWVACSTLSDAPFMYELTKGLWKGVIFGNFAEMPDSQAPLMLQYKAAYDKFADKKSDRWGVFFYCGFGFAEPMIEGIKRCGKDLTPDNFAKQMETLKDFQGIMGKVTFTADQHQGSHEVFLGRCDDEDGTKADGSKGKVGKAVRLSDWLSLK